MMRGCRPAFNESGRRIVESRTGKLDSPGENDQFDLIEGELSDGFGWGEAFVLSRR